MFQGREGIGKEGDIDDRCFYDECRSTAVDYIVRILYYYRQIHHKPTKQWEAPLSTG